MNNYFGFNALKIHPTFHILLVNDLIASFARANRLVLYCLDEY